MSYIVRVGYISFEQCLRVRYVRQRLASDLVSLKAGAVVRDRRL